MRTKIIMFLLALAIAILLSAHARAGERIDVYNYYPGHGGGHGGSLMFYSPYSPDIDRPCFPQLFPSRVLFFYHPYVQAAHQVVS